MSVRLLSTALLALGLAAPAAFAGERPAGGSYTTSSSSQGCYRLVEEGPGAGREWREVPCRSGAPESYIAGEADLRAAYDARHGSGSAEVGLLGGPPPPSAYVQGAIRADDLPPLPPQDYRPAYDEYARPPYDDRAQGQVRGEMPIMPAYEPNLGIEYARPTYDYGVQGQVDIRPAYEPNLGIQYARPSYDYGGQAYVQGGAYGSAYAQRDYLAESYVDRGAPPPPVYRAPPPVYQDNRSSGATGYAQGGQSYRYGSEARVESHGDGYAGPPPVRQGAVSGYATRQEYSSRSYEHSSSETHESQGSRYGPPRLNHGEYPPPAYGYVQRYLTWPGKTP